MSFTDIRQAKQVEDSTLAPFEDGDIPHFNIEQVRSFRSVFRFLNDKDRDILYLIFVSRKKQKDVQRIMGRSQPSLCYDIRRIRERIRFIVYLHSVFDIFVSFIRRKACYFTPSEIEILTLMFYTSSFTAVSGLMGMSQVRVRYSFNKCLRRMEFIAGKMWEEGRKEDSYEMWEVYEILKTVQGNLNVVRRGYKGDVFGLRALTLV
jgi:succinate dehydrogenase flavin-adding protein (antitoxin of CptAB toxin-antitoxin module)